MQRRKKELFGPLFFGVGIIAVVASAFMLYKWLKASIDGSLLLADAMLILGSGCLVIGLAFLSLSNRLLLGGHTVEFYSERSASTAPVVLLRSFCDDEIGLGIKGVCFQNWAFCIRNFQQLIGDLFANHGPLVAIDNPSEELPDQGAQRICANQFDWQDRIDALMESAQFLVILVGSSPGLAWEIQRVSQSPHLARAILVFPPSRGKELLSRWRSFLNLQSQLGLVAYPESLPDFPLFAFFYRMPGTSIWQCRIVEGGSNWPKDYREGFKTMMEKMPH